MKNLLFTIALIFAIISGLCVSLTLCLPSDYQSSGILAFILSIVIASPLFLMLLRRDRDIFEIINLVSLILLVNYVMRPIVLIFNPNLSPHPEIITPRLFSQTLYWLIVGVIALFAGYYAAPNLSWLNVPNLLKYNWRKPTTLPVLIVLFFIGLGAIGYGAMHGYFGRVAYKSVQEFEEQNYVMHFGRYMWYAVSGLLITYVPKRSLLQRIIFLALSSITLIIVILSGSRGDLVYFVMMLLTVSYYRGLLPRIKKYILPGLLFMFLVFSYMQLFRDYVQKKGEVGFTSFAAHIESDYENNNSLETLVKKAVERQHMFDSFAVIINNTSGESQYVGMGDFAILLPKAFIPRFLWPNKPDFEFTKVFTEQYWKYGPWPAPSSFGSLYARGGPFFMIAGIFIWGVILRLVYIVFLRKSRGSDTGIFLYSVAIFPLVHITAESDIATVYDLVKTAIYLTPFVLLLRLRIWSDRDIVSNQKL